LPSAMAKLVGGGGARHAAADGRSLDKLPAKCLCFVGERFQTNVGTDATSSTSLCLDRELFHRGTVALWHLVRSGHTVSPGGALREDRGFPQLLAGAITDALAEGFNLEGVVYCFDSLCFLLRIALCTVGYWGVGGGGAAITELSEALVGALIQVLELPGEVDVLCASRQLWELRDGAAKVLGVFAQAPASLDSLESAGLFKRDTPLHVLLSLGNGCSEIDMKSVVESSAVSCFERSARASALGILQHVTSHSAFSCPRRSGLKRALSATLMPSLLFLFLQEQGLCDQERKSLLLILNHLGTEPPVRAGLLALEPLTALARASTRSWQSDAENLALSLLGMLASDSECQMPISRMLACRASGAPTPPPSLCEEFANLLRQSPTETECAGKSPQDRIVASGARLRSLILYELQCFVE